MDKLVEKDTQGPDVQGVVVSLVLDHFWSHVLQGTTKSIPLLTMIRLNTPSKITNFNDVALFDQDIFRLNISVDKSLLVHVVDAGAYLDEKVEGSVLTQVLFFSDQVK